MFNGCKKEIFIWQKLNLNFCAKVYKIEEKNYIKNKTGRHQNQDRQEVHLQTQLHFQHH